MGIAWCKLVKWSHLNCPPFTVRNINELRVLLEIFGNTGFWGILVGLFNYINSKESVGNKDLYISVGLISDLGACLYYKFTCGAEREQNKSVITQSWKNFISHFVRIIERFYTVPYLLHYTHRITAVKDSKQAIVSDSVKSNIKWEVVSSTWNVFRMHPGKNLNLTPLQQY